MSNKKRIAKKRASLRPPRRYYVDIETYCDFGNKCRTVMLFARMDDNGQFNISKIYEL